MSHYTCLVCLPGTTPFDEVNRAIGDALEPYNENTQVEPYRDYEKGGPTEFWWVTKVRRGAEYHRDGTGVLPHYPDDPSGLRHSEKVSRKPEDEQRAEFADDAVWAERLGPNPSWELVVQLYNQRWCPPDALAVPGDTTPKDEPLLYDPEEGRPYEMSTYNPLSKWDWWVIGGRWQRSLVAKQGVDSSCLINGEPGSFGDNGRELYADGGGRRCDGAQRMFLDFEAMRTEAELKASRQYDIWERIVDKTPPATSWADYRRMVELGDFGIKEARTAYHAQARVQMAEKEGLGGLFTDAIEEFSTTREEYLARARAGAVPGYALLTLEGQWAAPGEMGWFGVSTDESGDREVYQAMANKYLDGLAPEAYVVLVDLHI